jgi:lipopolysaccharide transport system permease protein
MINPHANHPTSLAALMRSLWQHRDLITQMTRREVVGRYRGSIMGIAWSFFNPVLMLIIYTFVFSVVFKARWNTGSDSKSEFAVVLFAGMIIFTLFSECINRAPSLILSNVNYVKKVVFPLEILPWVTLFSALFHFAISLFVWMIFYAVLNHSLNWTIVFLPLILIPLAMLIMGICWFLAALGVYLRDMQQVIGVVTTILMFISPIFFPVSSLPEKFRPFIYANPLTFIIEQARDVLMWGKLPDWPWLGAYTLGGLMFAFAGFAWFQKTKKGFADVL